MAQSPSPPPPSSLSLLCSLFFSFSSLTATYVSYSPSMFAFHFSLTHLFFSLPLSLRHPPLSRYLICSFRSPLISLAVPPIVSRPSAPSFLLSASLLLQFFPRRSLLLSVRPHCFQSGERKREKRQSLGGRKRKDGACERGERGERRD